MIKYLMTMNGQFAKPWFPVDVSVSATFDRRAVRRPAHGVQIRARPRSRPFDTVIVDHAAAVGSGTDDTQALHRIDPATVRAEV